MSLLTTITRTTASDQSGWVPLNQEDVARMADDSARITQQTPEGVDFLSSSFLLGNVGAPFVIGLAVGYFTKKVLKIALFLGGAAVVALFVAEYYGVTTVSNSGLQDAANTATSMARDSGQYLVDRLSRITTKGVSAGAGFFTGLKFG
ncbi:MAG TPA: FUN14 domain-containing protein [Thiolinea sp.]|nr:FUN14 domain-containing protein [Thiolinea sp.]